MLRRILPCGLVLALACASGRSDGLPQRPGCVWLRAPRVHDVVLDSAALAEQLSGILAAASPRGRGGFTVHFTDGGRAVARDSASLGLASLDSAEAAIESMLLPPEPGPPPPPFHLVASDGQLFGVGIEACRPVLVNQADVAQALGRAQREIMRDAEVLLRIRIDDTGLPREVTIARSSGDAEVDAVARAIAQVARFRPGVFDGLVLGGVVELPVTFVTR